MSGKSKRKRYQQIKKASNIQRQDISAASTTAAPVLPKAAITVQSLQPTKRATTEATAKTEQYTYIPGDLKMIGMLTGIIAVILVVLYLALS
jgi:hypothetical protein